MTQPTLHHVDCPDTQAGHRIGYWQWGDPMAAHVVVCVHGLSRQGRDFDVLANALCAAAQARGHGLRVVCPDMAGRGQSQWLADRQAYQVPTYAADMLTLLAKLHLQAPMAQLDWVGTSMGGLIGLAICGHSALPLPTPVRRLVLNDVGPTLSWSALERIGQYLGRAGEFDTLDAAADALWAISSGFGPHSRSQWLDLCRPMLVKAESGRLRLHYDPAIATAFTQMTPESTVLGQAALWGLYDAITAQTLVLRGADSDLLTPGTALDMTQRGPHARLIEFAGVGHAPTLVAPDQSAAVVEFLLD
jgi:pimeloyl-ACP methyl ester carboxylesterase